jgi:hypothetical protein
VEKALPVKTVFILTCFNICHRNHSFVNIVGRVIQNLLLSRPTYTNTLIKNHLAVQTVRNASLQQQLSGNIHSKFTPLRNHLKIPNSSRLSKIV